VVLSVVWAGHKHFIVQTTTEGLYRFEGPAFPTVHQVPSPLSISYIEMYEQFFFLAHCSSTGEQSACDDQIWSHS